MRDGSQLTPFRRHINKPESFCISLGSQQPRILSSLLSPPDLDASYGGVQQQAPPLHAVGGVGLQARGVEQRVGYAAHGEAAVRALRSQRGVELLHLSPRSHASTSRAMWGGDALLLSTETSRLGVWKAGSKADARQQDWFLK
jgi:hypothetical protein